MTHSERFVRGKASRLCNTNLNTYLEVLYLLVLALALLLEADSWQGTSELLLHSLRATLETVFGRDRGLEQTAAAP